MSKKIAEGKTKIIKSTSSPYEVLIESKDDITAGDGLRHDIIKGKGILANTTACNCFELLGQGVGTHFIKRVDVRTFLARRLNMIPLEVVVRGTAFGSYLKRNPQAKKREELSPPSAEFFFKDDAMHDPLVLWNNFKCRYELHDAKKPRGKSYLRDLDETTKFIPGYLQIGELVEKSLLGFLVLKKMWSKSNALLVDIKFEFGYDAETGELLMGDVVDNDSWRIWLGGDSAEKKDKDLYRELKKVTPEGLAMVKDAYKWVAEATKKFNQL